MKRTTIFFAISICLLSFQQEQVKRIVIVAYREPELMYGHIKQVIELRPDRKPEGDIPQLVPDDTTTFDKLGDPIRTSFGEKGYNSPSYATYYTKYDSGQWRKETDVYDTRKLIYYFDKNGRVIKREEPGPTQPISYVLYYYNSLGELSNCEDYGYHKELQSQVSFEYDLKGLLESEEYHIRNYNSKVEYTYLSFDETGNWTKRVRTGGVTIDTVERKITYY